ncbi:unnamed protein product [Miscanthus lutarioriparius]|uniref:DUF7769 domain-containing protein n=1 Tax=Miscanthus lutarioriparius TaxID=422564 RepID=A0A811SC27_9POAL|nr:unnamed protein product [Miscanthus lutarioriparius]
MAPREFDLNRVPADWDLNDGIDSGDATGDRAATAHELDCDTVRDDGEPDGDGLAVHNQGDDDSCDAPSGAYTDPVGGHDASNHVVIGALEHGDGGSAGEEGSNAKKRRRYYSDDLKIAIYLELLAKTDPPVLRRGVSSQVAQKFGVPLRVVQSVWRKGQDYGRIDGVKNKMHKNCGRKRIEIDFEAIKAVPLSERKTFQKLANALGVKKSTLHSCFKEGYFVRTPKT